jgi:exodeoxyribonuclease V alpha subunit
VTEAVAGWVRRVVYNSDEFFVLDIHAVEPPGTKQNITARGNLYGLLRVQAGVPIRLRGRWRKHPKYGRQFSIRTWEAWSPDSNGVRDFLRHCINGFADGEVAVKVAEGGSAALQDVPGAIAALRGESDTTLSSDVLQRALLGWEGAVATRDLSALLKTGGLGQTDIQLAMARFGAEAAQVIAKNPYRLMEVTSDFPKIDRFAVDQGLKLNAPERVGGAILWALRESAHQGNLYLRRAELPIVLGELVRRHSLFALADDGTGAFDKVVAGLVEDEAVVLEAGTGIYLPEYHSYERRSAKLLASLLAPADIEVDLKPFLEGYERSNRITLSDAQREAVERLALDRVLVLTGLPGTGKTTAVRALVRLFEEAKVSFALMAPTGIAAKRLAAVTGQDASTIHRALRYDGMNWGYGGHNRYVIDAVIVDEVSMVDQELLFRLLSALRPDTVLVLVGDDAQLPSVGPGNVLRELVSCEDIPNVRLTQIFRQSEKGEIVLNAHRINRGEMPKLPEAKKGLEFRFVRLSDEERMVDFIVGAAERLKSRDSNFQVLSPKYKGTVGVDNLNERLRDRLNPPGPREWQKGFLHFRQGDRLMVIQNDYERAVYNGDVGKLVYIGEDNLIVRIHGIGGDDFDMEVEFPFDVVEDKLRLAYTVSVHKSQGSEFDTIILPVVKSQGRMLQRNLLYTAVTRARKFVWLVGEEAAVYRAVQNNQVVKRNTAFAKAVTEHVAAGVVDEDGGEGRLPDSRAASEAPTA